MISELIVYGGPTYWALLSIFITLQTLFALKQENIFPPLIIGFITNIFVYGFTTFTATQFEVILGTVAHFVIGGAYAAYRWSRLVYEIKLFTSHLPDDDDAAVLTCKAFTPNDAKSGKIRFPPDPVQFKTRILMWILFWPSFTIFWPVGIAYKWISTGIWNLLSKLSGVIYAREN